MRGLSWWVGIVLVGLAVSAPSAGATFPGANGVLAVQPSSGGGVLLVDPRSGTSLPLCPLRGGCEPVQSPRFSPDGRVIGFGGGSVDLIYSDGSCLRCGLGSADRIAFLPDRARIGVISGGELDVSAIGFVGSDRLVGGGVTDATWSSSGEFAVVRRGWIWVGTPGALRRLGRGSAPSFSPDGRRLTFAARGWVRIVRLAGGRARRVARGGAPAFSPDGRLIAYFGPRGRLRMIRVGARRSRPVGNVRGVSMDWQARPAAGSSPCPISTGWPVVASTPEYSLRISPDDLSAVVCDTASGIERVLLSEAQGNEDYGYQIATTAAAAGNDAAIASGTLDQHYGGSSLYLTVYDLRTGEPVYGRGGEGFNCPAFTGYGCGDDQIEAVVVGADAVSAVLANFFQDPFSPGCPNSNGCLVQEIIASDASGVRVLDTAPYTSAIGPLSHLSLDRDTLSWTHSAQPKSEQLHP